MKQQPKTIAHCIQQVCFRNLFSPTVYLIILFFVWFLFPFSDLLFPHQLSKTDHLKELYHQNRLYVDVTLQNLLFSGYTCTFDGDNKGYYYYTTYDNEVVFVLLSPKTCEEGISKIEKLRFCGVINHNTKNFREMLTELSQDLDWTKEGMKSHVSSYFINEPDFRSGSTGLFLLFYFASGAYALFSLLTNAFYVLFPTQSPPCRRLGRYGKATLLFAQAEEELAASPYLASEDLFVTEHYFIALCNDGVVILPIQKILWIYKYSGMHKFLKHYFRITYRLHISAANHVDIRCPQNTETDIEQIMAALSAENPNILIGFSEENRKKLKEINGKTP